MSNEPAFPTNFDMSTFTHENQGMTLRDYFAAAALTGMSSLAGIGDATIATECYKLADAMMEARK